MATPRRLSGYGPMDQHTFAYDGSIAIPMGSLLYHDTNDVKPALSAADAGTYAQNKAAFALLFAGVAVEAKTTASPAGEISVATEGIWEFDCVSATFEIGDFVAPSDSGPGVGLLNTSVTATSTANERIGVVVKRYAAATTRVRVKLISRVIPNWFAIA